MPLYTARSCSHVFHPKLCPCISRIRLAVESPASPQRFFSPVMALERPRGFPDQPTVEPGGDVLKTGRVTGALVQCPKLCPCISPEVVPVYFTNCVYGRESSRPSTLPPVTHSLGVALELLWSIYCGVWGSCAQDGMRDRCSCTVPEVVPLYFIRSCARIFHEFDSRTRVKQALNASSHPPQPWSGLVATLLVNLLWSLGAMRSRRDA